MKPDEADDPGGLGLALKRKLALPPARPPSLTCPEHGDGRCSVRGMARWKGKKRESESKYVTRHGSVLGPGTGSLHRLHLAPGGQNEIKHKQLPKGQKSRSARTERRKDGSTAGRTAFRNPEPPMLHQHAGFVAVPTTAPTVPPSHCPLPTAHRPAAPRPRHLGARVGWRTHIGHPHLHALWPQPTYCSIRRSARCRLLMPCMPEKQQTAPYGREGRHSRLPGRGHSCSLSPCTT